MSLDVNALLTGAAKKTSTKKKSDVPLKEVKGSVAKAVAKYSEMKKALNLATAKLSQAEDEILPTAREFHAEEVKNRGALFTTVKLTDGKHEIQIDVAKNQYGKIDGGLEETLKEKFGDDYDMMFEKKISVSLSKKALADNEIIIKLIKAVGQDKFTEYFDVTHNVAIKERFHNDRFMTDDKRIAEVIAEQIVKPNKPAMRG